MITVRMERRYWQVVLVTDTRDDLLAEVEWEFAYDAERHELHARSVTYRSRRSRRHKMRVDEAHESHRSTSFPPTPVAVADAAITTFRNRLRFTGEVER